MHFILYVCLPASEARTSLQARRKACEYLEEEHFVRAGRFCGHCDYFHVGGRYSGTLALLRLKHLHPRKFKKFMASYMEPGVTERQAVDLFSRSFPEFEGMLPFGRREPRDSFYGHPDDAQIMDEALFAELRGGFNEYVTSAVPFERPNVIFTDLDETEWPVDAASAVGKHWVVVIDYHD